MANFLQGFAIYWIISFLGIGLIMFAASGEKPLTADELVQAFFYAPLAPLTFVIFTLIGSLGKVAQLDE